MNVSFEILPEDFLAFRSYASRKNRLSGRLGNVFVALIVLFCTALWVASTQIEITLTSVLWALAFLWVLLLVGLIIFKAWVSNVARDFAETVGFCNLSISEEGLSYDLANSKGTTSWAGIKEIIETEKHIFLQSGSYIGVIVPKRAFPSPEAGSAFLMTALSYWKAAREAKPA